MGSTVLTLTMFRLYCTFLVLGLCTATVPDVYCEHNPYHLDPEDCPNSFYHCIPDDNGGWIVEHFTCPSGSVFDPNKEKCVWPELAPDNICDGLTHFSTAPPTQGPPDVGDRKVICYWQSWAFFRGGRGKMDVEEINPDLCTHLNYGWAVMDTKTYEVKPKSDWYDLGYMDCDNQYSCRFNGYRRFNNLKTVNPELKTILSIGGSTINDQISYWYQMAASPTLRKSFIHSAISLLLRFGFDGADLDWEHPGHHEGTEEHMEDLTALVQEMGAAFKQENLLFSVAVSANIRTAMTLYDVPSISQAVDWINIKYDYDGHEPIPNVTYVPAPLYGRGEEAVDHPGTWGNVNDTVNWYIDQGAPPEKLILGLGLFGRGWIMPLGSDYEGVYCPARDPIPEGEYLAREGFLGYCDIMEYFNDAQESRKWSIIRDGCYMTPYAVNGPYWIGYDDLESIKLKSQFVNYMKLGGAMVFSLDTDDWHGDFSDHKYPLTMEVLRVLSTGETLDPDNILGEDAECESAPMCEV